MANTASSNAAPIRNVALMRSVRPFLSAERSSSSISAVRSAECAGRERGKNVSCCDAAADGQDRRPGEPIAPHREGRDQLAVADPCRRAIDGGAPGLAREHPCNLGIGESLDEAEQHRERPHDVGRGADGSGDAADREQHQRRDAAGQPERVLPADVAAQSRRDLNRIGSGRGRALGYRHRPRRFIARRRRRPKLPNDS